MKYKFRSKAIQTNQIDKPDGISFETNYTVNFDIYIHS